MKKHFELAIENILAFGDTDIFPYPVEHRVFFDKKKAIINLLRCARVDFKKCFVANSPNNISTLSPVGYTGFRWATQLDPFWNAYLLGLVISLSSAVEAARIPVEHRTIFSYRIKLDAQSGRLFDENIGWSDFMLRSRELASQYKYVLIGDIADCYQRIYHHRLENALKQLKVKGDAPSQIMEILSHFSQTKSYGLPIGGPAARILSELVLNLTDKLLCANGVVFCRFADDYHVFANDLQTAYRELIFISEKLLRNDGLSLQKSKTKIMTSEEFLTSTAYLVEAEKAADDDSTETDIGDEAAILRLSLRFDPYSPTAHQDYERLKKEIGKFDIIGLLNRELAKTRVHGVLTKKLISAVKFLDPDVKNDVVLTLLSNLDNLYPIFPTVAQLFQNVFSELSGTTQEEVCNRIAGLVRDKSYLFQVDLNVAFAIRLLALRQSPGDEDLLVSIFKSTPSSLLRREVILAMAKWSAFYWLTDLMSDFHALGPWERRAFILASYTLGDAGSHWRTHMKDKFSPLESLMRDWAGEKAHGGTLILAI